MPRKIVVIPTFNERGNIPQIVPRILGQDPEIEVLVVDDSSPDGTGAVVEEMRRSEPRVHLLTRGRAPRASGRRTIAGFKRALEMGADLHRADGRRLLAPAVVPAGLLRR